MKNLNTLQSRVIDVSLTVKKQGILFYISKLGEILQNKKTGALVTILDKESNRFLKEGDVVLASGTISHKVTEKVGWFKIEDYKSVASDKKESTVKNSCEHQHVSFMLNK